MAVTFTFERIEKKYLLNGAQRDELVRRLADRTVPESFGLHSVCNIYYDTPGFELIRRSLERPVFKEKLRLRSYGVPGKGDRCFAELKKKYDGVVYKRRVEGTQAALQAFLDGAELPGQDEQIKRELRRFLEVWQPRPAVFIGYDRFALLGRDDPGLRITFDTNLRYRLTDLALCAGDHGLPVLPDDPVIMEIKLPAAAPLWLARLLSETGVYQSPFSKYGACYTRCLLPKLYPERKIESC